MSLPYVYRYQFNSLSQLHSCLRGQDGITGTFKLNTVFGIDPMSSCAFILHSIHEIKAFKQYRYRGDRNSIYSEVCANNDVYDGHNSHPIYSERTRFLEQITLILRDYQRDQLLVRLIKEEK